MNFALCVAHLPASLLWPTSQNRLLLLCSFCRCHQHPSASRRLPPPGSITSAPTHPLPRPPARPQATSVKERGDIRSGSTLRARSPSSPHAHPHTLIIQPESLQIARTATHLLLVVCGRYAAMKRAGVRGVAWWHTGAVSYGDDNGNGESMWCASRARGFFCCSSCASLLRKLRGCGKVARLGVCCPADLRWRVRVLAGMR